MRIKQGIIVNSKHRIEEPTFGIIHIVLIPTLKNHKCGNMTIVSCQKFDVSMRTTGKSTNQILISKCTHGEGLNVVNANNNLIIIKSNLKPI